jgi:acyl transferase domain-containing protein
MVLAGGVHVCLSDGFWNVFSKLGALSRSEQMRPFDRRADGLLIGEGVGIVVLKRLAEAERDGDAIYAVIRGCGSSSDGRAASLVSPAVRGQVLALERAWKDAGLDPTTVGMVEAHGTGTVAGDQAELTTLAQVFGTTTGERAVLGSVKSMIGHAMPAAGAAGLIKAILAVHHGMLFPSLHCEQPNELLEHTRFRVLDRAQPWQSTDVRRAGVNAFGFGGVNSHVVVDQHPRARARIAGLPARAKDISSDRIATFAADGTDALIRQLKQNQTATTGGPVRAALFDPTPERVAKLVQIVERGKPWRDRDAMWFNPRGLLSEGGQTAILYPGIDATFEPRVEDLMVHFGAEAPPTVRPETLEEHTFGVIQINRLMRHVLEAVNVPCDHIAGHSIGEWSAMVAAGALTEEARLTFMNALTPGNNRVLDVFFGAAGCDAERAQQALEGLQDVTLSHDNCPHQVLICGRERALDVALARLKQAGVMCQKLSFQSGYHTPFFAAQADHFRTLFAEMPVHAAKVPLWSATSCAPYPDEPELIRALSLRHLLEPVRFRPLIEALYARGVRVFVQAGVGSLANFSEDTLRGRAHLALSANVKERSGLEQLRRLLASLFVEGANGLAFDRVAPKYRHAAPIALGVPVATAFAPLALPRSLPAPSGPLASEFGALMAEVENAQREVFELLSSDRRMPRRWTVIESLSLERFPELRDHALFPQRPGWPEAHDSFPVVPLTMLIELATEHAAAAGNDLVAVGVENMSALKWLEVSGPTDVQIRCDFDGNERVKVHIGEYVTCEVVMAKSYPAAPAFDDAPLANPRPSPITGPELYETGRMFHGPAYQGLVEIEVLADDGCRAMLRTPSGRASLLDNAGQLFGVWIQERYQTDWMAFPVGARALRFFGPQPAQGELVRCTVRIISEGERTVSTNMMLAGKHGVWCAIEGWNDRRFEMDQRLWRMICAPNRERLASVQPEGWVLFENTYRSAATRQQLEGRFLNEGERQEFDAIFHPREQRRWLAGRVAAKDAARELLAKLGHSDVYPAELTIRQSADGLFAEHAKHRGGQTLRVAIDNSDDVVVGIASAGAPIAIAIERFDDDARTRAAKRVAAQLGADQTVQDATSERLLLGGLWIASRRQGDFVIAWAQA